MRVFVVACLAWSLAAAVVGPVSAGENEIAPTGSGSGPGGEASWLVGYSEADITPRPGQAMMAGYGQERCADGALAPLRAQVVVFQDASGRRAMFCAVDVLGFGPDTVAVLRRRLEATYGLPPAAICLAASHTHWGPAINISTNLSIGATNVWYLAALEKTIVRLTGEAIGNLVPAKIDYGACDAQIGMCRRQPTADGKITFAPHAEGSYDRHTPILRIVRQTSPKQLVLVGHACHPTSSGGIEKWSPDYPGAMRDRIETKTDDCRVLFAMGCGGDAKAVFRNATTGNDEFAASPDQARAAGEKLAEAVLVRLKDPLLPLQPAFSASLAQGSLSFAEPRCQAEIVKMAIDGEPSDYGTWWARHNLAYPDHRRSLDYEVQVWRLGGLAIVALEGEVCADWGGMIRAIMPSEPIMVIAYANFCPGYIPTARIIREGGYEGHDAHKAYALPSPFQPKMEDELRVLILRGLGRDAGVASGSESH